MSLKTLFDQKWNIVSVKHQKELYQIQNKFKKKTLKKNNNNKLKYQNKKQIKNKKTIKTKY